MNSKNKLQEELEDKYHKDKNILLAVGITYISFIVLYFVIKEILKLNNMEYRNWTTIIGRWIIFLTPFLVIGCLLKRGISNGECIYEGSERESSILALQCLLILDVIIMVVTLGIIWVYSSEIENVRNDGVMEVVVGGDGSGSTVTYYDNVFYFARKKIDWNQERDIKQLEEKYGTSFVIAPAEGDGIRRYIPEKHPEIKVRIIEQFEMYDDYSEKLAYKYFKEFYSKNKMTRKWCDKGWYDGEKESGFCLQCNSKSDITSFTDDAIKLIEYAMEDTFFQEQTGSLECSLCNTNDSSDFLIMFGKGSDFEKGATIDVASRREKIIQMLLKEYENLDAGNADLIKKNNKDVQTRDMQEKIDVEDNETKAFEQVESAYNYLYQQNLSKEYQFSKINYNAKGNFYSLLEEGNIKYKGEESVPYDITVVYDRKSDDGKYQMFVQYRTYYTEDNGTKYVKETCILKRYLVNVNTGEILVEEEE